MLNAKTMKHTYALTSCVRLPDQVVVTVPDLILLIDANPVTGSGDERPRGEAVAIAGLMTDRGDAKGRLVNR
jgi:DUF917 family protein